MTAPHLTDRERAQRAEARVAELEAELAAWRAYDAEPRVALDLTLDRESVMRRALRNLTTDAGGAGPARTLLALLDAGGRVLSNPQLVGAARHGDCDGDEPDDRLAHVYVCRLRRAVELLGFRGVIATQWGRGYYIEAADAARLRAALLGEPHGGEGAS